MGLFFLLFSLVWSHGFGAYSIVTVTEVNGIVDLSVIATTDEAQNLRISVDDGLPILIQLNSAGEGFTTRLSNNSFNEIDISWELVSIDKWENIKFVHNKIYIPVYYD